MDGDESDPDQQGRRRIRLTNFRVSWASPQRRNGSTALFCTNCSDVRTTSSIFNTLTLHGPLRR